MRLSPVTAATVPARASSSIWYLLPEYRRTWSAFSSQSAPRSTILARSVPPVTFSQVNRSPLASREILNTRAPNSAG